jgi:hypothetical protein
MQRFAVVALLAVMGCGDGEGIVSVIGPPTGTAPFAGTWRGSYTNTAELGTVFTAVMQLTQTGNSVSGTLTTNEPRAANVSGTVTGNRLNATFAYTDGCVGGASTVADLVQNPTRLIGTYTSNDACFFNTSGDYFLDRQ